MEVNVIKTKEIEWLDGTIGKFVLCEHYGEYFTIRVLKNVRSNKISYYPLIKIVHYWELNEVFKYFDVDAGNVTLLCSVE